MAKKTLQIMYNRFHTIPALEKRKASTSISRVKMQIPRVM